MDPKLVYWTAAFVNMAVLTGFALAGVRHIRRGEMAHHRRAMTIAALLVVVFLVSYPLKLMLLGREDRSSWSTLSVGILRFHEVCVLVMSISGALAFWRGRRLARASAALDTHDAPPADPHSRAAHRRLGRIAIVGAVLGLLSAGFVLAGMFART